MSWQDVLIGAAIIGVLLVLNRINTGEWFGRWR